VGLRRLKVRRNGTKPQHRRHVIRRSSRVRCLAIAFGRSLTRRGVSAELERGERQAWQHQQTRRSLSAQLVHGRRARRDPLCEDPWYQASALAYGVVSAPAHKGRCHRARQQDGPNGMGNDDQGRALQATRRTRGVNEIASGIRRDVTVGKGEQHVMQSRSIRRSGQPTWATALSNACN
jgi:hypothetical protein